MNDESEKNNHHFRFHLPFLHVFFVFGDDWFSLKAEAFARFFGTPLILLAQTRQADHDKAHSLHREALASASEARELFASQQSAQLLVLLEQNTKLTEITKALSERIESLTQEIHTKFFNEAKP